TAFARCYVNDAAVMEARNPSYPGWAAEGYLTITPGNETDFGTIESDILDLCKRFKVLSVAYDPWAASNGATRAEVARVFGLSASRISAMFKGQTFPTRKALAEKKALFEKYGI